jgi:8-oxo-dGTP pyrophosphatase MutT (NUDIX family)
MSDIKKTARAIIFNNCNELILIKRRKYKNNDIVKEYYVFPGGHLDENESFKDAVIREIKEELGISVKIERELVHCYNEDLQQDEVFFECKYLNGVIGTGDGEEWTNPDIYKYGSYEIVYVNINELHKINVLPSNIKEFVIQNYKI